MAEYSKLILTDRGRAILEGFSDVIEGFSLFEMHLSSFPYELEEVKHYE